MKTPFFIITILVAFAFSVQAQDFKAGALGGATFSQVHGDNYVGFNKIGILGGLYVSRSFGKDWAAQMEIVYKQKGSRHQPNESKGDYNLYKLSFDYLEVPLLAKMNMNNISFEGGFAISAMINSKEEDQYGPIESIYPFQDFEVSGLLGINYQFHPKMFVNLRWSYAITRVRKAYGGAFDDQKPPHWMDGKYGQYNHLVSFSLYYEFESLFNHK